MTTSLDDARFCLLFVGKGRDVDIVTFKLEYSEEIMKFYLTAAAVAAAAMATPALAQDTAPFSGAHVGVEGGWGRVAGTRVDGTKIAGDGFVYGGTAGYDFAIGNLRAGPEIEITGSTQKTCVRIPQPVGFDRDCERSGRDLYVGGRLGYVIQPSVMLYAKAGYTNARFSDRFEDSTDTIVESRTNQGGVRVGGGVEYSITPQFYVSGEYRYSHYGKDDRDGSLNMHQVRQNQILAGIGFRF